MRFLLSEFDVLLKLIILTRDFFAFYYMKYLPVSEKINNVLSEKFFDETGS